jgi:adenine-specific DNA methylase
MCASGINVYEVFMKKVWEMYSNLEAKQGIKIRGQVETKVEDVRNLKTLVPDGSLDYVVTHPPYLNNYNYLLHDRLPMFFLGYFKTLADEKEMRSLIMGSIADGKPSANLLDIPIVQEIAGQVKKTRDKKRHEAIIEYCSSMNLFFRDLHDKLREDGLCAMLVGNSYVRGVMVPLDIIIAKIAEQNGFLVAANSVVRDRGNGAFQHLYNGKLYESIVILKRSQVG